SGVDPQHPAFFTDVRHAAVGRDVAVLVNQQVTGNADKLAHEVWHSDKLSVIAPEPLVLRERPPQQCGKPLVPHELIFEAIGGRRALTRRRPATSRIKLGPTRITGCGGRTRGIRLLRAHYQYRCESKSGG